LRLAHVRALTLAAPLIDDNMNTKFVGRLGLSDDEEDEPVSFMRTLADGFMRR
jgi:cytochrome c peroxidase